MPRATGDEHARELVDEVAGTVEEHRVRRRLSESRSRARRKENLDGMRARVKALECAVANVMFVGEVSSSDDSVDHSASERDCRVSKDSATTAATGEAATAPGEDVWDELLDDESTRMRVFLRRSVALAREARQLEDAKIELARMLREYEVAVKTLRTLTKGVDVDDWTWQVHRWRAITRAHFTPWTEAACLAVVDDSVKQIQRFAFSEDAISSGLSFLGWRDRRRLDASTSTIQFSFSKTYRGFDLERATRGYWETHQHGDRYSRIMLGPNTKIYYDVLQHVSPDMFIVRCVEQYPGAPFKAHMLFLFFRVRTASGGYLQCLRTIPCPQVQLATDDDDAVWTSNFHWTTWDVLARNADGDCTDFRTSVCGSLGSETLQYVSRWMGEALMTLVRAETALLGRHLLEFPDASNGANPMDHRTLASSRISLPRRF